MMAFFNYSSELVGLKAHSKSETTFGNWKPFKNDEKWLFHLKNPFRSQDI